MVTPPLLAAGRMSTTKKLDFRMLGVTEVIFLVVNTVIRQCPMALAVLLYFTHIWAWDMHQGAVPS